MARYSLLARRAAAGVTLTLLFAVSLGQKKPLDLKAFDGWKSVRNTTLSRDGKWLLYVIAPQEGDNVAEVRSVDGDKKYSFERAGSAQITKDGKFAVATIVPKFEEVRNAKKAKTKPEDMPKNSLLILNLETGDQTKIDRVTSFSMPQEDSGWIVYRPEPPKPEVKKPDAAAAKPEEKKPEAGAAQKPAEPKKPTKKADDKPGNTIVVRNLASGKEEKIEFVSTFAFPKDGSVLAYALSTKDGSGDGVVWEDLKTGQKHDVVKALGKYPRLTLANTDKKLAFLTDKDDYASKTPSPSLYLYDPKTDKTELIAKAGTPGIPKDWWVHDTTLNWSDRGTRLFFATHPKPVEDKKDDTPDDEKVSVDVWSWTDPQVMPQQLLGANAERNRGYTAAYNIADRKVVQLANADMPTVVPSDKGDGEMALGTSKLPYLKLISWDTEYQDYYAVNMRSGQAKRVLAKSPENVSMSPAGKYFVVYDPPTKTYTAVDTKSLAVNTVSKDVPYPLYNELSDIPGDAPAYGVAGWTKNDDRVLIYDNYDIWSIDPSGRSSATNVTGGYGRSHDLQLRIQDTDPDLTFVPMDKPLLLDAMNHKTKASGYYRLPANSNRPEPLIFEDKSFTYLGKAHDADVVVYSREDTDEYRDIWLTNMSFQSPRKITNANPQQSEYNWAKSELVRWTTADGDEMIGLLFKPENFDYSKKYPMIAYYYERDSDNLHLYYTPSPSASTINPIVYASNGYIVFIPDIKYKVGYPGQSALASIVPGVLSIVNRGYVDPKRLGIQGQSWGGYQTGYLITQTNLFAAACAGAPVSDMVSAYGGIRWGEGILRSMQYEKGQSRIGGSLWEKPLRYIENSPIFYADKVNTPLLMMNNDKDGAVPWYQGIEYFAALRRLNKPAWLVVYNGEDHNLVERKNRKDWTQRMQQFFDHYLKGAPMPVWMEKGVPATLKGRTFGFELPGKTDEDDVADGDGLKF